LALRTQLLFDHGRDQDNRRSNGDDDGDREVAEDIGPLSKGYDQ